MTAERRLERLTSPEIAAGLAAGRRTVLLPCAAIEQHGPHLPLSVDADHADELALRVAERLDALVAPTLRIGCSAHHLDFAGTLSLRPETLEALYVDCCRSLARHGFDRILIFSGHIGNFPVLEDIAPRLAGAVPADVEVSVFTDKAAVLQAWRDTVQVNTGLGDRVGGHADIAETSIMLSLDPGAVRGELIEPGFVGVPDEALLARVFKDGVGTLTPNGVLGDPRDSSAELGELCLEAVTTLLVDFFDPPRPDDAPKHHEGGPK
jgi:creatinine amidohydrolase